MTWLQYPFLLFALLGSLLICSKKAKTRCKGFISFIVSNGWMIAYALFQQAHEDAIGLIVTYIMFLVFAIYGLWNNWTWRQQSKPRDRCTKCNMLKSLGAEAIISDNIYCPRCGNTEWCTETNHIIVPLKRCLSCGNMLGSSEIDEPCPRCQSNHTAVPLKRCHKCGNMLGGDEIKQPCKQCGDDLPACPVCNVKRRGIIQCEIRPDYFTVYCNNCGRNDAEAYGKTQAEALENWYRLCEKENDKSK